MNPLAGFGLGSYTLMTYPTTTAPSVASMSAASSSPLSSLLNYTFNSSTTQVSLNVARNTTAGAFTWVGGTSGGVDGATNGNWTATDSTGTYTVVGLYPGLVTSDTANVALTSTPTTITLGSAQTIGTLNLTGTGVFSLSGSALTVTSPVAIASGQTIQSGTLNAPVSLAAGGTIGGTIAIGGNVTATGGTISGTPTLGGA